MPVRISDGLAYNPEMDAPNLLQWSVTTINRQTRTFGKRVLYLNTSALPPALAAAVTQAAATPEIINYRHLFGETNPLTDEFHNTHAFSLVETYYEDAAGNPMNHVEFMDALAGGQKGVLLGKPESVLRFGPTKMNNTTQWSVEKANTIAHFLEVVKYLAESKWIRTGVSYQQTFRGGTLFQPAILGPTGPEPGTTSKPLNFKRPDLYTINAILVLIRQLVPSDALFKRAYEIYTHHCADQGRLIFAQHEQQLFDQTLVEEPMLFAHGYTGDDILRLFFYEFGLMHRPKPSQTEKFRKMIEAQGRERTFMAFHSTLHRLTASGMNLARIVAQDFQSWIDVEKQTPPNRVSFDDILRDDAPPEPGRELGKDEIRVELSTGGTRP
jgi:hypothetical protein